MRALLSIVAAAMLGAAATASAAPQTHWSLVGTLDCNMAPSIGLIVGSRQQAQCVFTSKRTGRKETYTGSIGRLGLDIGFTGGGKMVWSVMSRTTGIPAKALAGSYTGASGDVAVVGGVGANILLGGSKRSISLQPLSVEGQVGVNLALGVATLTLQ